MVRSLILKKVIKKAGAMSDLDIDLQEAAELGKKAFHSGLKRVPALDKKLLEIVGRSKAGSGFASKIMGAWLKAWDKENLNQKVSAKLNLEEMSLDDAWDIVYKNFAERTEVVKPNFSVNRTLSKTEQDLLRNIYDNAPVKKLYTYSTSNFGFLIEDLRFEIDHGNLKIRKME